MDGSIYPDWVGSCMKVRILNEILRIYWAVLSYKLSFINNHDIYDKSIKNKLIISGMENVINPTILIK